MAGAPEIWLPRGCRSCVEPLTDVPPFDALKARLDNAALLRAAGVTTVLAQPTWPHFRDLRQAAGNAVRNGLAGTMLCGR